LNAIWIILFKLLFNVWTIICYRNFFRQTLFYGFQKKIWCNIFKIDRKCTFDFWLKTKLAERSLNVNLSTLQVGHFCALTCPSLCLLAHFLTNLLPCLYWLQVMSWWYGACNKSRDYILIMNLVPLVLS